MAVTILFNLMKGYSRFRLWRIDAAREKLETALKELVDPSLTQKRIGAVRRRAEHETIRARAAGDQVVAGAAEQDIVR
jgi:hypothetical protein